MDLDDRMDQNKKRQEVIRKRNLFDEDEETYTYAVRPKMGYINESQNGVFDIKKQTGINTAKSVFDKSIFRTGN